MDRKILVLTLLILAPGLAGAQRRVSAGRASGGSGSSFKTTANHAPAAQRAAPGAHVTTSHHSAPAQASSPNRAAPARSFRGGSYSPSPRRSQNSSWFSGSGAPLSRSSTRRLDGDGDAPPAEAPQGNDRTYLNTPGALIRTEGLGAKIGPGSPERVHEIEGGGRIAADERYTQNQTNQRGLFVGARDTPPNPTGGTASGNNSITPNSTTNIDNSISGNGNNNGHNSNNGGQGNGNGGN